jgi:hypothetical protein
MAYMQIQEERKKEKPFPAKSHRTTIYVPYMEEEDVEMNPMMRQKRQYNHRSQPHTPTTF